MFFVNLTLNFERPTTKWCWINQNIKSTHIFRLEFLCSSDSSAQRSETQTKKKQNTSSEFTFTYLTLRTKQNHAEPNRTKQNQAEPSRTTQPPPADWAVTSGEFRATLVRISRSLNGVVLLTLAQFLFSDPHFYFQEVDAVARRRRWSLIWKSAPSQKHTTWSWETLRRKTDVHIWLKETIWPTGSLRCDPVRQLDSDLQRSSELQRSPRCCRQRVGGNFSFPLLQQQPILLIAEAFTTIINGIIQKSANLLNNLL